MTQKCDNFSVGVIIKNSKDELLLIEREKFPHGFALPAGHIDAFSSPEACAIGEVKEEVGLDINNLKLLYEGEHRNVCRRKGGNHHYWYVYEADFSGGLIPSQEETKNVFWCGKELLRNLYERTIEYKSDLISDVEWENNPGLEPVWCDLLKSIGVLQDQD